MISTTKIRVRLILIGILMIVFGAALVAQAVAGQGDGSGGGKDEPLRLISSSPAHGEVDVPLDAEIQLGFSKNVVHMTVRDSNIECFSLYRSDGTQVSIEVHVADDQIEPEKKRDVKIRPSRKLEPGTVYTLKIAPEMESKSGVTLGQEVLVSFTTTGGAAVAAPSDKAGEAAEPSKPAAPSDSAEKPSEPEPKKETDGSVTGPNNQDDAEAPASAVLEEEKESSDLQARDPEEKTQSGALLGTGLGASAAAIGYAIYRKTKKRSRVET